MPPLSPLNSQPSTLNPSSFAVGLRRTGQLSSEWSVLETIPGLIALPGVWRQRFGDAFEPMKDLILRECPSLAQLLPCPRGCGLAHDIICRPDGSLVATCGADPNQPRDILLTPTEITPWEVSWSKLGHALFEILELHGKSAPLPLPNTLQIGAWSADGVPVILTVQVCGATFRRVVAELVARLQRRFILLAPTSYHCDAPCQELLAHARAAFFPLETTVLLSENRHLRTTRPPGELFAQITPPRNETDESEAARVFRLFGELLGMGTDLVASPARVFDLMVFKKMTKAETALECRCVASLITKRVALIERHFAMPIARLRAFASDLKERQRTVKGDRYARKKQGAARDELAQWDDDERPGAREGDDGYLPEERQSWTDS